MKFKPLRDRVLVKFSTEEEKTAGGLFIPDSAKEKPQRGTIIAVGSGKITDDGKRQSMEIRIDDEDYLIIREEDVLGIVE
jgi:chaperonin GroES